MGGADGTWGSKMPAHLRAAYQDPPKLQNRVKQKTDQSPKEVMRGTKAGLEPLNTQTRREK